MRASWKCRHFLLGCLSFWVLALVFTYVYTVDMHKTPLDTSSNFYQINVIPDFTDEDDDGYRGKLTPEGRLVEMLPQVTPPVMLASAPRLSEYCNNPSKPVMGDEGMAPTGFRLTSVHVMTRHGDRNAYYNIPRQDNPVISCSMNPALLTPHPKLSSFLSTMHIFEGKQHVKSLFKNWAIYPSRETCSGPDLTQLGALQHILLGHFLSKVYIHKWQLFVGKFDVDKMYIRSTDKSRTYQSAVSFLYGFLPEFNLTKLNIHHSRSSTMCDETKSDLSCNCLVISSYQRKLAQIDNAIRKQNKQYQSVVKHISQVFRLLPSQIPELWPVTDVLMAHICHGVTLKCNEEGQCIDANIVTKSWNIMDNKSAYSIDAEQSYDKIARLQMLPLLKEIVKHIVTLSQPGNTDPRFMLFSGHDSTLTGMLVSLGISDGKRPPYASRLIFETYIKETTSEYFIQVLYNGDKKTELLPFCKSHLVDGLCPLHVFDSFVNSRILDIFSGRTYSKICSQKS